MLQIRKRKADLHVGPNVWFYLSFNFDFHVSKIMHL